MIGSIVSSAFKLFPGAQFTFDGARLLGKFPRGGARLDLTLSPEEAEAMAQTALDLAATLRRSLRPMPHGFPATNASIASRVITCRAAQRGHRISIFSSSANRSAGLLRMAGASTSISFA